MTIPTKESFETEMQKHYDKIYGIYFDDPENNQELTLPQWFELFKVHAAVQTVEHFLEQDSSLTEEQLLPLMDDWVKETFQKEKLELLMHGE